MKTAIKIVVVSMCLVMLASCSFMPQPVVEETTQNNVIEEKTMSQKADESLVNTTDAPARSIQLNTGEQIKIGDSVEVTHYQYEGKCVYTATVLNMYPETGTVWEKGRSAVLEYHYRFVVDVQSSQRTCLSYEYEQTEDINQQIRSVVRLGFEGDEELSYMRDLSSNEQNENQKIMELTEYKPPKTFSCLPSNDSPQEICEYYNEPQL